MHEPGSLHQLIFHYGYGAVGVIVALEGVGVPLPGETILIFGAIYVGSVNDYGYNRSMKDGLEAMKQSIPGLKLIEAENVPETAEAERIMEGMVQQGAQGAKLIFATSFGHQQFAFNVAKAHPDVVFEHAGGWMMAPNFGNFFGATQATVTYAGNAPGYIGLYQINVVVPNIPDSDLVPVTFALGNFAGAPTLYTAVKQ